MSFAEMRKWLHSQHEYHAKKSKYKFGRTLGAGTFGVVREAEGPTGTVAVKIILKKSLKGNEQMLYDEIAMLQKVKHPHIVEFVDWFESSDKFYIVMQLATGGELFDRICSQGRFTEKDAAETIRQALLAVDFLHQNQIVHRDLKPENLLYLNTDPDSDLVLADFGIAKTLEGSNDSLTGMAGSFGYCAPEIMLQQGHGKPVDMWSMGVITYTILCGYSPYRSDNLQDLIRECTREEVVFHQRYWEGISDDAKDFIRRLLTVDPEQRLTSKQALAHTWLTGKNATDNNLLPDIRRFRARSRLRRLIQKIQLYARIEKLREQEEDPENSDLGAIFHVVAKAKIADDKEEKAAQRAAGET